MTETQYFLGWAAYLLGGTGCMLGLWLVARHWHPRIKRFVMVLFAVFVYLPDITRTDMDFLAPAFLITLFDGLTYGSEAMIRTGKAIALVAGVGSLIALLLPVSKLNSKNKKTKKTSDDSGKPAANEHHQRKEPVY